MSVAIEIPTEEIAAFCRRHHIRKLAFFGSVLREDFMPQSDVDVLVEFEPRQTPGLAFFAMQRELSALLGRNVDLNTAGDLSPYFRKQVLAEAEVQYESAWPDGQRSHQQHRTTPAPQPRSQDPGVHGGEEGGGQQDNQGEKKVRQKPRLAVSEGHTETQ